MVFVPRSSQIASDHLFWSELEDCWNSQLKIFFTLVGLPWIPSLLRIVHRDFRVQVQFHHALVVPCGGTVALANGRGFKVFLTSLLKSYGYRQQLGSKWVV